MSEYARAMELLNAPLRSGRDVLHLDRQTIEHSYGVTDFAVELGQVVGLPRRLLADLEVAAVLHDWGKIHFRRIVEKPGPLTPEEGRTIARHPLESFKLINQHRFRREVANLAYHHHEAWDGSGYPQRLAGSRGQLSIADQVLAASDITRALLEHRSYRPGWEPRRVYNYVGEQWDRKITSELAYAYEDWFHAHFAQKVAI